MSVVSNIPHLKTVNLGYKYRLYSTQEQQELLNHQMFVYNQAYNVCLNLWQKEQAKNKNLNKKDKIYRTATNYDAVVKRALKYRKISFRTVVTQQARINFLKAVQKAFSKDTATKRLKAIEKAQTTKEKAKAYKLGMPTFKSSKGSHQSFNWNNQGYQIKEHSNNKYLYLQLMKTPIKLRYHRELPDGYKLSSITISKDSTGYYVSFGIEFKKKIDLVVSRENLDINKSIGIDLNGYSIAVSQNANNIFQNRHNNQIKISLDHLINNDAEDRKKNSICKSCKNLREKTIKESKKVFKK